MLQQKPTRLGLTPLPSDTPTEVIPYVDLIDVVRKNAELRHYLETIDQGEDLVRFISNLKRESEKA